jgi:hypothetical protein
MKHLLIIGCALVVVTGLYLRTRTGPARTTGVPEQQLPRPVQTTGIPEEDLPPPVLSAFQKAYPGGTLKSAARVDENGRGLYKIESVDQTRGRGLLYAPDGSLVETIDEVSEGELPDPVRAAARSHPRATIERAARITRGGKTWYDVTLKGSRKTHLAVEPDGNVLSFE